MPPSDALFGADGTQSGTWRDEGQLPPFVLPRLPDTGIDWATVAAAYRDDAGAVAEAMEQDFAVAQAVETPAGGPPVTDPAGHAAPPAPAPPPPAPPPPAPTPPTLAPSAPSQPRRSAAPRRRPVPAELQESMSLAAPSRRLRGVPLRSSSDGGAAAFFLIMWIVIGLLAFFVITGILDSISEFLP